VVPLINCLTSVYAGFVIFSVLGYMAAQAGVEVKDVVDSGMYDSQLTVGPFLDEMGQLSYLEIYQCLGHNTYTFLCNCSRLFNSSLRQLVILSNRVPILSIDMSSSFS